MCADRRRASVEEIRIAYGKLARRHFPDAELVEIVRASDIADLVASTHRDSTQRIVVRVPAAMDGKLMALLRLRIRADGAISDKRVLDAVLNKAAPLLDCLCRELRERSRRSNTGPASLPERNEEMRWLSALTERLHLNSSDPRAVAQLTGAVVERLKCCFGAVVVPRHSIDVSYSSLVNIDVHAAPCFERCRDYLEQYTERRGQAWVANKPSDGQIRMPFKFMLIPVPSAGEEALGSLVILRPETAPNFGRRQLFLALHLARQIGALLESQYDLATGLLTRSGFCHDIQKALDSAPEERCHTLLQVNIDRLRAINEHFGFETGDEAIAQVADLLRHPGLPQRALIGRLTDDRFAVFLPGQDPDQAWQHAQALMNTVTLSSVGPESDRMPLSIRCGIARLHGRNADLQEAINAAEAACERSKDQCGYHGKICQAFDDLQRRQRPALEIAELRNALLEGRFCVYGQKIIAAGDTADVRGIECSIHMLDENGEAIPPSLYLPSVHRHQMQQALDHSLILQTLRVLKSHRDHLGDSRMSISVNVSSQSLQNPAFTEMLEGWLLEWMRELGLIRFEIAETAVLANWSQTEKLADRLRQVGCGLVLNDVGDGVDSMSYLEYLPVSGIKIDGGMTTQVLRSTQAEAAVRSVVDIAARLRIDCAARRVQFAAVAQHLATLGVGYLQGNAIHHPEPLRELLKSLSPEADTQVPAR